MLGIGITSCAEEEEMTEIQVMDVVGTDDDEDPINPPPPPGNY